jgi:hypothetical protein
MYLVVIRLRSSRTFPRRKRAGRGRSRLVRRGRGSGSHIIRGGRPTGLVSFGHANGLPRYAPEERISVDLQDPVRLHPEPDRSPGARHGAGDTEADRGERRLPSCVPHARRARCSVVARRRTPIRRHPRPSRHTRLALLQPQAQSSNDRDGGRGGARTTPIDDRRRRPHLPDRQLAPVLQPNSAVVDRLR